MPTTGLDAIVQLIQTVLLVLLVAQNVTLRQQITALEKKIDGQKS
jgi:hypothetical protein